MHDAREQIASKIVGAEQMRTARRAQGVACDRGGVIARKPGANARDCDQAEENRYADPPAPRTA